MWRYPYRDGETAIADKGEKILSLPAGGYNNHWTRNLLVNADGSNLFVTVGSSSNVGENGIAEEKRRANVLEINLDGSGEHLVASGMSNPNGLGYEPKTACYGPWSTNATCWATIWCPII